MIQLYSLLDILSNHVDSRDELGTIIGYTVMDGLFNFKSKSGSFQERQFEEVKTIYRSFDSIISASQNKSSYAALCNFKSSIDPLIERYISGKKITIGKSYLLSSLLNDEILPRKKNHVDILRRDGLRLYFNVNNRGSLIGAYNILTNDYSSIKEAFNLK